MTTASNTVEAFETRIVRATAKYLERRGWNVLDSEPSLDRIDIVADDDGAIVFVEIVARDRVAGFSGPVSSRSDLEGDALSWMAGYHGPEGPLRFDLVEVVCVGNDRAIIRHLIDQLGFPEA